MSLNGMPIARRYMMVMVVFSLFPTIFEIFAKHIKLESSTLKMKVKEKETGFAPFDWKCSILHRRFFRIFTT